MDLSPVTYYNIMIMNYNIDDDGFVDFRITTNVWEKTLYD